MPPFRPPLKNDGPACRVCGCTEHNACIEEGAGFDDSTCSWVKTASVDPKPLCSACSGTAPDLAEAMGRVQKLLDKKPADRRAMNDAWFINRHALARYRKRKKEVDAVR